MGPIIEFFAAVYIYTALCIVCGMGAKAKGKDSAGYLFAALFLTPLVVYAYLLLLPDRSRT